MIIGPKKDYFVFKVTGFVLDFTRVLLGKGFYQRHYMTFDR